MNEKKIAIVTDSCADISKELQEQYQIHVLPIMISCTDGEYKDGIDIYVEDIYKRLENELPKTSTPTGEDMENMFRELQQQGYEKVIAIMLSGGLSGTVNHMRLVAEDAQIEICIIDSRSASIGCGAIVLQVADYLNQGYDFDDLCEKARELCGKTKVFFSIDTLEYLQKGGRIGKATAFVGTALNIKPILSFDEEGEIFTPAKVRGSKLVEKKLISLIEEQMSMQSEKQRYNLIVADGGAVEERQVLEQKLITMYPDYVHIYRAKIGAALSAYLGAGLLGAGIQYID